MRCRAAWVVAVVVGLASCGGATNSASRDRCEAAYGVGNCVSRHGAYVPVGVPLGAATTAPTTLFTTTTLSPLDECNAEADTFSTAVQVYKAQNSGALPAAEGSPTAQTANGYAATLNTAGILQTPNVAYFSTGGYSPSFATARADANLSWQYNGATGAVTKGSGC